MYLNMAMLTASGRNSWDPPTTALVYCLARPSCLLVLVY